MSDLPLWAWLIVLFVFSTWLLAGVVIGYMGVSYMQLHDVKEFWYRKYSEEHKTLEIYRNAARKGEFNA